MAQASFLLRHIVRYDLPTGRYLGQFAPPPSTQIVPHLPTPSREEGWSGGYRPAGESDLLGAEDLAFDWNGDLHVTAYWANAIHK